MDQISWCTFHEICRMLRCRIDRFFGKEKKTSKSSGLEWDHATMNPMGPLASLQDCYSEARAGVGAEERGKVMLWCLKQLQEIVCWPCIVVVSHHKIRLRSKQTHVYPYAYDLWYLQEQARAEKEIQLEREKLAKEFQVAQKQARGEAGGDLTWLDYAWLSTAFQHVSSKRVLSLHNFEWEVLQDPAASVRGQTCSCGMTCYHPVQQNHRFVFGEAIFALL